MEHSISISICPVCEASQQTPYAVFPEFEWVKCTCGLISKRGVAGVFADAAVGGEGSFGETGYGRRYDHRYRHRVGKSLRQIEDAREFVSGEASRVPLGLLDVGCSLGYTLEAAQRLGMLATGVDVSETAVERCRGLRFSADVAGLEKLPYPDEQFSIVVMKHVLEHTRDPETALREARRVLRRGGVLFISVPNAEYRKAAASPLKSRFYRPDAHGGIEHWIYYTPRTLARLLGKAGFKVVRTHPLLLHGDLSLWRRCLELPVYPFRRSWAELLTFLCIRKEFWIVSTRE